ncbi:TauD/TfdA family dioxygenase [Streptomyces sp. P1-3]|uniref:TauD/TfdA family dioxygenase n=1 Tax=Streptomyces sp. P1-3 TaxID=3421658 RepID=UPI003D36B656
MISPTEFPEVAIGAHDRRAIFGLATRAAPCFSAYQTELSDLLNEIPAALHESLRQLTFSTHESGYVIFRGIASPDTLHLPSTPTERSPRLLQHHWTAGLLLLTAELLGSLIGYADEKDGALIHDVHPVRGEEERIENSGSVEFDYHTENVHHPLRPDYLGLLCLRQDHDGRARLRVSSVRHALRELPPHHVAELRKENFSSRHPTSFTQTIGGVPPTTRHPVLFGSEREPCVRFNAHHTKAVGAAANSALTALATALRRAGQELDITSGDLVVVDNHTAVHGRSAFTPRYDGQDRWLRRFYALRALPEGMAASMPRPRVLPPLDGAWPATGGPSAYRGQA